MTFHEERQNILSRVAEIDKQLKDEESYPVGSVQREWLWEDRTRAYGELDELERRSDS